MRRGGAAVDPAGLRFERGLLLERDPVDSEHALAAERFDPETLQAAFGVRVVRQVEVAGFFRRIRFDFENLGFRFVIGAVPVGDETDRSRVAELRFSISRSTVLRFFERRIVEQVPAARQRRRAERRTFAERVFQRSVSGRHAAVYGGKPFGRAGLFGKSARESGPAGPGPVRSATRRRKAAGCEKGRFFGHTVGLGSYRKRLSGGNGRISSRRVAGACRIVRTDVSFRTKIMENFCFSKKFPVRIRKKGRRKRFCKSDRGADNRSGKRKKH